MDIAFQTRRLERTFNSEMITAANQYNPDYAVPPGWVLEEELESKGISRAQFSRICGLSTKSISKIIAGKAPIEPETAMKFDRALGGGQDIWLRMESYIVYATQNRRKN